MKTTNEFCVDFEKLFLQNVNFIQFMNDPDPLCNYDSVDWREADDMTFIRMMFARGSEMGGIYPEEGLFILDLFREFGLRTVVEIGTMHGVSTRLLAACCEMNDGHMVSIDGDDLGVDQKLSELKILHRATLLHGWTPWISYLPDNEIDFLFIDGDHDLVSVLSDYHYYNYFLRNGGVVAFHDVNIPGVMKAVQIAKERDQLESLCEQPIGRLLVFQKTTTPHEKYFQIIER